MTQVLKFNRDEKGEKEWLEARKGRATGTRLGDLIVKRGTGKKKGFWEIIAERVAIPESNENVMDRGHRLEQEAVDRFMQETGKKVNTDLVLLIRPDNEYIAYSPDGRIGKTEDVEVKCLNSASHIEAWYTKKIPSDYYSQIIQGFIVNDSLKTRYMIFYDPRMPVDFFYMTIHRKDVEKDIKEMFEIQLRELELIAEIEKQLLY